MLKQGTQNRRKKIKAELACLLSVVLFFLQGQVFAEEYLSQADFLKQDLGHNLSIKTLWISSALREQVSEELNYPLAIARVRYWESGDKRAWIVNEVGRDKPITMGFVIQNKKIITLRILVFRESRGYEVRYPRFTSQFVNLGLEKSSGTRGKYGLDHSVDNVTGATLSVNAVKKSARLALYLNEQVELALDKVN